MADKIIGKPLHIQEAASTDDTSIGHELVVLENQPQLGDLQQNDGKDSAEGKETTSTPDEPDEPQPGPWAWLFSLQASYVAGVVCWTGILAAVCGIATSSAFDGDDVATTTSTDTTCDADLLDGLAVYFLDKKCVAELSCEGQHQIVDFIDMFLNPLRVEAIFFTNCFMIFSFMVLQQGGIPATTKDNKEKSRWYLGCFAWLIWVSCGECITFMFQTFLFLLHTPSQSHSCIAIHSSNHLSKHSPIYILTHPLTCLPPTH